MPPLSRRPRPCRRGTRSTTCRRRPCPEAESGRRAGPGRRRHSTPRGCDRSLSGPPPLGHALRLPPPRLPAGLAVEEDDDRPDLLLGEELFPHRHRRIPGSSLPRQAGAALGDPPEDEAFGQLGDGAVIGEGERRRTEAVPEVSLSVEPVSVTGKAILVVHSFAGAEMLLQRPAASERILQARQLKALAPEGDLSRRCRRDRPELN